MFDIVGFMGFKFLPLTKAEHRSACLPTCSCRAVTELLTPHGERSSLATSLTNHTNHEERSQTLLHLTFNYLTIVCSLKTIQNMRKNLCSCRKNRKNMRKMSNCGKSKIMRKRKRTECYKNLIINSWFNKV